MRGHIERQCLGREICLIDDFGQFMRNESYLQNEVNYPKCVNENALFYVQVHCLQSENELSTKKSVGTALAILIILQALIFTYNI
jgi:hypothetical protein